MLVTGLTPNLLAGWFNLDYNFTTVIDPSDNPALKPTFWHTQGIINAVCFPLGVVLFIGLAWPVARGLHRLRTGDALPPAELATLRLRALRLGWYGVWISLGFWVAASIVYPVWLRMAVPGLPDDQFRWLLANFVGSLLVCGLIAAAYPFFFGTALATGAMYPAFLRPGLATPADVAALRRRERALWPFFGLAAAVPLLAVAALVMIRSQNRLALLGLCLAGLVGLGVAVLVVKRIQRDLADLAPVVRPAGGTASLDSLIPGWGG
jgi:hypothetical protein